MPVFAGGKIAATLMYNWSIFVLFSPLFGHLNKTLKKPCF